MSGPAASLRRPGSDWLVPGAALLASLALVWLAMHSLGAVLAFAAGLVALGGIALALTRRTAAPAQAEYAMPDWSVTVAAIDRSDAAVELP